MPPTVSVCPNASQSCTRAREAAGNDPEGGRRLPAPAPGLAASEGPPGPQELRGWGALAEGAGDTHPAESREGLGRSEIAQCWDPLIGGRGVGSLRGP